MKPHDIYDTDAAKRAVNLSANSSLVKRAQEAGLSLSKVFEEALGDKLRETLRPPCQDRCRLSLRCFE